MLSLVVNISIERTVYSEDSPTPRHGGTELEQNGVPAPEGVIGLFGLAGIAGALIATNVGHYVDKGQAKSVTKVGLTLLLFSWLPMAYVQYSIYGLIVGIILLDLAVQGLNVINQSTIYKILPEAQNRLTSAYMTSCCSGTALGSIISIYTYKSHGWFGIVISGLIIFIINLAIWFYMHKHETKEFHYSK